MEQPDPARYHGVAQASLLDLGVWTRRAPAASLQIFITSQPETCEAPHCDWTTITFTVNIDLVPDAGHLPVLQTRFKERFLKMVPID